ncbi:MAG: hydroxymethylglutaryl-CoA reductase, degradative [Deltaproteobacteria bacterium]|nr:hydroxymethylglutaryl-CoA reductase, degradative [Deltaproteobacteria bacterium]
MKESPFEGFSRLTFKERHEILKDFCGLSQADLKTLTEILDPHLAEQFVENVIGFYSLPLAIAPHFKIDGKNVLVPMAIEETSVVAAVSKAAKLIQKNGGFHTQILGSLSVGQIQFPIVFEIEKFEKDILNNKGTLINQANQLVPRLTERGGGVQDIKIRKLKRPDQKWMGVLHILCDTCDAMGANTINQICEFLKPLLEEVTGSQGGLCILSNLTDSRLVEARCTIQNLDESLALHIEEATLFANLDPYRGTTHNKGIMNGIDAVLIATGNDWRAVEAGAHAYASLKGHYQSLSSWVYKNKELQGTLQVPLQLGIVGGVTQIHPTAKLALRIMGIREAHELARICASVGLAQNFAALRALCQEGISHGHMKLHASNLALAAGATKQELPMVQTELQKHKHKTIGMAQKILDDIRRGKQNL